MGYGWDEDTIGADVARQAVAQGLRDTGLAPSAWNPRIQMGNDHKAGNLDLPGASKVSDFKTSRRGSAVARLQLQLKSSGKSSKHCSTRPQLSGASRQRRKQRFKPPHPLGAPGDWKPYFLIAKSIIIVYSIHIDIMSIDNMYINNIYIFVLLYICTCSIQIFILYSRKAHLNGHQALTTATAL